MKLTNDMRDQIGDVLKENKRLKEVCRVWCCRHTALLVAIGEAGFRVEYDAYEPPAHIEDRKRPRLVARS